MKGHKSLGLIFCIIALAWYALAVVDVMQGAGKLKGYWIVVGSLFLAAGVFLINKDSGDE